MSFFGAPVATTTPGAAGFGFGATPASQPVSTNNATSSFNFGGATNAPASQPAVGGLSFGVSQPAPSNSAAPPTFGLGSPATSNASAPSPAFAFGSTAASTPAPVAFGQTPAPTLGGFSSGWSSSNNTNFPASSAFSFGGTNNSNMTTPGIAPAPAGGFGGASSNVTGQPQKPQGLEVPDFYTIFPSEATYSEVRKLLDKCASPNEDGREAACDLVDILRYDNTNGKSLGQVLASPKTLKYTSPDVNLRNQIHNNPTVVLPGNLEAILLPEMQKEVLEIADDLKISEKEALSLYAEASKDDVRAMLEAKLDESIIDQVMCQGRTGSGTTSTLPATRVVIGSDVVKAAKELYFFGQQRLLQTILLLVQKRIGAQENTWGALIIEATDNLLRSNLIQNLVSLIREWTCIITQIELGLARGDSSLTNSFPGLAKEKKAHFDMVHREFAVQERQTAAEILFYIAYHTQFKADEVAAMVDLIKDITNGLNGDSGLPLLSPFHDVPSSYENPPPVDQAWAPFQSSLPPLREKGHLEWQADLVDSICQTSKPDLLRCVGALVVTVIAALDSKQVLMDRETHRENDIGVGNKLASGDLSLQRMEPLHRRLTVEGCRDWMRTDICGLLCGAYAMLLKGPPSLLSPPRAGSSPSRTLMRTVGDCLSAPTELKSITFANLCLLPALQRSSRQPGTECDSSEFFLAVLSEFVANFMDILSASGNLPVSRASWIAEKEEGLQLARENRQQAINFKMWSGQYEQGSQEAPIPTSVDLMKRPDCMDDVVALAVAIASLGPEFALKFWSKQEINDEGEARTILVASRANKKLRAVSAEDSTLDSFYLAFLAALAKAEHPGIAKGGADVVHSILSNEHTADTAQSWAVVLNTLRWYCRQFDRSKSTSSTATGPSGNTSSSYYYQNFHTAASSAGSSKSDAASKPIDIGEANTFNLLSLLGLIANVCEKSPAARLEILSKQLPITLENSSTVIGSDTTLNILFSLSTSPLPPDVRGATFSAISSLLCMDDIDEKAKRRMCEFATNAWELLDSCQILPIMLLDQYPQAPGELNRMDAGLRFPASSTSLAASRTDRTNRSGIPADQSFAILYEMEHVESVEGVYLSTAGFLRLLESLFSCCCPPELGKRWRIRIGCTPYVEIVIHYILPRATGAVSSMGKLPFRSRFDEAKLIALALRVVKTVLTRYSFSLPSHLIVPINTQGQVTFHPNLRHAKKVLGQDALVKKLLVEDKSMCTGGNDDFENKTIHFGQHVSSTDPSALQSPGQTFGAPSASSIPAPKSPGFLVLSDILSAERSHILEAVSLILIGTVSAIPVVGVEASNLAETYALFKDTPPTTLSAKHARKKESPPSSLREQLLKSLRPSFEESLTYSSAVSWQERCVIHALQILCAASVREEAFYSAVNSSLNALRIVPVLRFNRLDKRTGLASQINVRSVHLWRLQDALVAARDLAPSIVDFVGYAGSSESSDVAIATSGLSVLYFLHTTLPSRASMDAVCGVSIDGRKKLSTAMAQRLLTSFDRSESTADSQILSLVFHLILRDLRRKGEGDSLSHVLLGMSVTPSAGGSRATTVDRSKSLDCFDAILDALNSVSFIVENNTSQFAANCFEIFFRLCDLKAVGDALSMHNAVLCSERLRTVGFWRNKLELFLLRDSALLRTAVSEGNFFLIHSMSWLLRGIATELQVLTGFCAPEGTLATTVGFLPPRSGDRRALQSLLLGMHGLSIEKVIEHLPIKTISIDGCPAVPTQDSILAAMRNLEGPLEVVDGYMIVDEDYLLSHVSSGNQVHAEEYKRWCQSWNMAANLDCAARHLTNSLRVLIGAALVSFDARTPNSSADILASLLTYVVERLVESPTSQLSSMATLDLSWIALALSQSVSRIAGAPDLSNIRELLARAVVASGRHLGGVEAVSHQERTAILSSALVEIMYALPSGDEIDHNIYHDVAMTLAELSTVTQASEPSSSGNLMGRDEVSAVPTEAAIIARSSLIALVDILDYDIETPRDSVAHRFLRETLPSGANETSGQAFLRLFVQLDTGIVSVIEKVLQVPFVGDLLISEGLFDAFANAADSYVQVEQELRSQRMEPIELGFPPFLCKLLELFRTLLATSHLLSERNRSSLPRTFYGTLLKYKPVFDRAMGALSSHGQELCLLVECVAQITVLGTNNTYPVHIISSLPLQPVAIDRIGDGTAIENATIEICLQIAEHPLKEPAQLPDPLSKKEPIVVSSCVVPVVECHKSSWWDSFDAKVNVKSSFSTFGSWTEKMFQHAIQGAKILDSGLMVLIKLPLDKLVVEMGFVRGLFQLSKAAQLVEDEVNLIFNASPQMDFMETDSDDKDNLPLALKRDYLIQLGRKLSTCVHKLLLALIYRIKQFQQEPERRSVGDYCKSISCTLNLLELKSEEAFYLYGLASEFE